MRHITTLGKGTFGQVELVEFTDTGALGAAKKSVPANRAVWENEMLVTNKVHSCAKPGVGSHFVVKSLYAGCEAACDVLVLEYCSGGEFLQNFAPLEEKHARFYLANLGTFCRSFWKYNRLSFETFEPLRRQSFSKSVSQGIRMNACHKMKYQNMMCENNIVLNAVIL